MTGQPQDEHGSCEMTRRREALQATQIYDVKRMPCKRRRDVMRGAVLYGTRDVCFEECDEPTIIEPTDAIIRLAATCVCGSDLWPYRGIDELTQPTPMGHEYCGIVEAVGSAVT